MADEEDPFVVRMRHRRERMFAYHLPRIVAEYPLEVVATGYGLFAATATLIPRFAPPSTILGELPPAIEFLWGICMMAAAVTMLIGLHKGCVRLVVVSRGVGLFGVITIAFGVGILAHFGYGRALSGTFLIGAGVVAIIRSMKLRMDYYTALEALTVEHRRNGDSGSHAKEG